MARARRLFSIGGWPEEGAYDVEHLPPLPAGVNPQPPPLIHRHKNSLGLPPFGIFYTFGDFLHNDDYMLV